MIKYVVKRLLLAAPVFVGVSVIVFVIMASTPGDPVLVRAGFDPNISQEKLDQIRRELGLDQPIYVQYFRFINKVMQGDLGNN
ncbi:MAG: hypothetical protein QXJ73_04145, partial [Candidatus Caldarchaeum sp.]